MNATTSTIRFNSAEERRTYEQGLALVKRKLAQADTEAQHRIVATRLGIPESTVSSVIRDSVREALSGMRKLKARVPATKPSTVPQVLAKPAPDKQASKGTVHKFSSSYHRICNGPIYG